MLKRIVGLISLLVLMSGCSASAERSLPVAATATQSDTASLEVSDALRRDAEEMAKHMGISVDEAVRRAMLQDSIGTLGAELEQHEADTFAGLWIQHEPEYCVVVAFTRNGDETIRRYVENTSLADLIEVRNAELTLAKLKSTQDEIRHLLDELGLSVASGIDVPGNHVELYVTDRPLFDASLQEANARMPDHIEVITIYEPMGDDIPFAVTPDPAIHFPQLRTRSAESMAALLSGTLIVQDGCLRVAESEGGGNHLVIWQTDYFMNDNEGIIEIWDRNGEVAARVGDEIRMGGGEVTLTEKLKQQLNEVLPERCIGPYWLMGELVSDE